MALTKTGRNGGYIDVKKVNVTTTDADFGNLSISPRNMELDQIDFRGANTGTVTLPITKGYEVDGTKPSRLSWK